MTGLSEEGVKSRTANQTRRENKATTKTKGTWVEIFFLLEIDENERLRDGNVKNEKFLII